MSDKCNQHDCNGHLYQDSVAFPPRKDLTPHGEIVILPMRCKKCGRLVEVEQFVPPKRVPAPERKLG